MVLGICNNRRYQVLNASRIRLEGSSNDGRRLFVLRRRKDHENNHSKEKGNFRTLSLSRNWTKRCLLYRIDITKNVDRSHE